MSKATILVAILILLAVFLCAMHENVWKKVGHVFPVFETKSMNHIQPPIDV